MATLFLANTKILFRRLVSTMPSSRAHHGWVACTRIQGQGTMIQQPTTSHRTPIPVSAMTTTLRHLCLASSNQCSETQGLLQNHSSPLLVPCCFKARGNTYQPSNVRRKRKHGFHQRMRTKSGIELIWRRLLKGRRLLTH